MNWKRSVLGAVAAMPVIALLAFGLTRDPSVIDSPMPGRPAPAFALPVIYNGSGTASLADHAGDIVVLNFFASWCLECRYEHEVLTTLAEEYRPHGVQFYGVLYDDSPANGVQWIEQMGGQPYPALNDVGMRTAIDFGLYGVPETFIIDRNGLIAHKQIGPWTMDGLRARLDAVVGLSAKGSE